MHCGRCGVAGHNATKCPNVGVLVNRPKKKKATTMGEDEEDFMSCDFGEGPSQVTQA